MSGPEAMGLDRALAADELAVDNAGAPPRLRYATWAEVRKWTPPKPPWVIDGYVARGAVTLLAGKPKVGKSTLLCAMAEAADAEASSFLGRAVAGGPVVYLSEEGVSTFAPKLPPSTRSLALTREAAWPKPAWPELIAISVEQAQRIGAVMLAIDALSFWAGFAEGQEKDAGATQATLDALVLATQANLAVPLAHHQRKSGGEGGDAVRGSGAIFGAVDLLLELERVGEEAPPGHRRLVATGRWPQTPPVLVVDREPKTGAWGVVGQAASRSEAAALGLRERLLTALPEQGPGTSETELVELVDEDKRKLGGPLRELVEAGLVSRTGAGQRGNPYRYEKVSKKVSLRGDTNAEKVSSPYRGDTFTTEAVPVPRDTKDTKRLTESAQLGIGAFDDSEPPDAERVREEGLEG